jgi:hypothetical protein
MACKAGETVSTCLIGASCLCRPSTESRMMPYIDCKPQFLQQQQRRGYDTVAPLPSPTCKWNFGVR